MKNLFPLKTSISLFFVFFLVCEAFSQNNVQDLIGARANSVDNFMNNKGYVHITSSKSYGGIYSYWWKSTKNKCVSIRIEDGHVIDAKTASSSDCRQNANSDRYSSNNYSSQSHQSHHHDSYNHYNNADHDNSFERGYNDGVHNKSYHNTYSNDQKKGTDRALVIMPKNGLGVGVTWQKDFRWCHSFCAPKIHDIFPWT